MRRMSDNSKEFQTKAITFLGTLVLLIASRMEAQTDVRRQIVVSIPDRKLALVENGSVKAIYPVAVGKDSTPSPAGTFKVVNRIENPTYYHPGVVVGPGTANPLGNRWIGLNQRGYGIHGTNLPNSIGKAASHGCIRMAKTDLEDLFKQVRPGDEVQILAKRSQETDMIFGGEPLQVTVAQSSLTTTMSAGQ
ncbi:MAG: L,D-transpeptidase [Acidobacteriaceae bacterium]